jgi:hypothetical protein
MQHCVVVARRPAGSTRTLPTTSTISSHRHRHSTSATRKLSIICNYIFYGFCIFLSIILDSSCLRDLRRRTLHIFSAWGLALPTHRSWDLRVHIFILWYVFPSPSTCSGACPCQPKGRKTWEVHPFYVCSSFNCLTLIMSIWCCVVAKHGS